MLHACFFEEAYLFIQGTEQAKGIIIGVQDKTRVRVKCQDGGFATDLSRQFIQAMDDTAMAQVNAIESARS